ncbi:MAG: hypothetical protein RIM99_14875 [Cyclobacteriaceae bacterium]
MKRLISLIALTISYFTHAQPSTEVYLFDLKKSGDSYTLSNPRNISANDGYDNQPSFWPDGKSILYARTVGGQTEIARYFLETLKTEIITRTGQGSEYSPTPMPDGRISSIRLDTTGLQLLYAYDMDGNAEVLVPELKIGYHAWVNKKEIVSFVLGQPPTMQVINTKNNKARVEAEQIGRSLHKVPNEDLFSYVDKSKPQWAINTMDAKGNTNMLTNTLPESEDYCWTPAGEIIMGTDGKLFSCATGSEWKQFADLADFELEGISRLTVSPNGDMLVVVVNK